MLTTLNTVKSWLDITDASQDAFLPGLIAIATHMAVNFLGYSPEVNSYTDRYNGSDSYVLFTQNRPITSVSAVTLYCGGNSISIPASATPGAMGYEFTDKAIYLNGYSFPRGRRNVEIDYTAGYATLPADLVQAANIIVQALYEGQSVDPNIASESVPGAINVTFRTPAGSMPAAALALLMPYKRVSLL